MEEIPRKFLRLKMSGIDQSIGLDKDYDKFAWGQIRMSFSNFHEVQLSSCFQPWIHDSTVVSNQQTLLIFTFINFSKPPQNKGKKPTLYFPVVKNFIFNLWLVRWSFLNCEKNHPIYKNLCSLLQILFCFVNLAWSKSWYVYDKQRYLHTHFKKFGPG